MLLWSTQKNKEKKRAYIYKIKKKKSTETEKKTQITITRNFIQTQWKFHCAFTFIIQKDVH